MVFAIALNAAVGSNVAVVPVSTIASTSTVTVFPATPTAESVTSSSELPPTMGVQNVGAVAAEPS
jgi:hypothetical protein